MMRLDKKLICLYRNASWVQKFHVIIRYLLCPFGEVERYVPKAGKILDLGCGYGIFTNILAMKADSRYVAEMDKNAGRIAVARSALSGRKNIAFRVSDIRDDTLDSDVKCVVIVDLPLETNRGLLTKIYAALPPEGVLIIKSISRYPRWKYYLVLFHMATVDKLLRVSPGKNAYFLKEEEFMCLLKEVGFQVKFLNIDKGYPCSHCLYICNKN